MSHNKMNLIGGEWRDGATAANINPSNTGDVIGHYVQATEEDTQSAIAAARSAFPEWSRLTVQHRADILRRIGNGIWMRRKELGKLLSREEGKTLAEGIGEASRAAQIFYFYSGECLRSVGEKVGSLRSGIDIDVTREALGVVGLITPWNFPLAIPAWKIAPALAYGNTVVIKPAELVPASAWALAEIITSSGISTGVFNLVMGRGPVVGRTLIDSDLVSAISFTGSVSTGRMVAAGCVAARRMKRFQLEMGGKNPLVIVDDADLATAVECAVQGTYFSTGQRCTASSRLIVTQGIHDRFVEALSERMETLTVDDALKPGTDIGPVVDEKQLAHNLDYIDIGRKEGARLIRGGERLIRETPGFFMRPALFTDVDPKMRIATEEIFGPVGAVIRVKDYEEALSTANDNEFGLATGIVTTSLKHATHFKRNAEAGMVMVNAPTAGVDYHVPFGGTKTSSFGTREQGRDAREFYTEAKTAYTSV